MIPSIEPANYNSILIWIALRPKWNCTYKFLIRALVQFEYETEEEERKRSRHCAESMCASDELMRLPAFYCILLMLRCWWVLIFFFNCWFLVDFFRSIALITSLKITLQLMLFAIDCCLILLFSSCFTLKWIKQIVKRIHCLQLYIDWCNNNNSRLQCFLLFIWLNYNLVSTWNVLSLRKRWKRERDAMR